MNSLGIALVGSTLQATLLGLLAVVLYGLASRRGSILAARVAALSLGILFVLTLAALCPLPSWWSWQTLLGRHTPASPSVGGITGDRFTARGEAVPTVVAPQEGRESTEGDGIGLSLARLGDGWDSLTRHSVEEDASGHRWPAIVPVLFLIGMGVGVLRLVIGIGSVSRYRQRSRAIEDAPLRDMLNTLQAAMNCHQSVEIRESSDVSAPATVGWRRPLILLPADWRTWTEDERRSVLAHELAHIRRADYVVGLLARISLVVHFYHPLAYWLIGRLQFQQELAADALAASCVGGSGPYLRTLARLLLRHDDRPPRWPARGFLSSSGTLLRRIGMLRIKNDTPQRTLPRSAGALFFGVLTGAAVALSALRGSGQQPADARAGGNEANTDIRIDVNDANTGSLIFGVGVNSNTGLTGSLVLNERNFDTAAPSADHSQRVPFDLTYLPLDAAGVVAIRPAEFFRRPGAAVLIDPIHAAATEALLMQAGLPDDPDFRLDAVEQVIFEIKITHNPKAPKGRLNAVILVPNLIRMEKSFDWKARMQTVAPQAEEIEYRGKTYCKGKWKTFLPGLTICHFIPDQRTLVLSSETTIHRVLEGQQGGSAFTACADWQHVEQGLLAQVIDVRRMKFPIMGTEDWAPLLKNTTKFAFSIDLHDALSLSAFATCEDSQAAETLVRWAKSQIKEGIAGLDKKRADEALKPFAYRLSRTILEHTHVEQHGPEATLRTHAAIDFAALKRLLMPPK